jgi:beta-glucosidase
MVTPSNAKESDAGPADRPGQPSGSVGHLLTQMTIEEKTGLVSGDGMWGVAGVDRLGITPLVTTDGPNGARGAGLLGSGTRTLCVPCGSALGATWDPALLGRIGEALGVQTRSKGAHVLLAPTVNLHRSPLGGRNFECYSEDPVLSGKLAAAFIRGVQSQRVATTVKHFAGNDAEFERTTIDARIDERTLREHTLVPFELAVREGGAWGVMAAYNRLNGTLCSANEWLLSTVLRHDWGFDGFVISDWFALRSAVEPARAGVDLEMPGPGQYWGGIKLADAVRNGEVAADVLDTMVLRALQLRDRVGAVASPARIQPGIEAELDRPQDRALSREAAAGAAVLLRNVDLLPLRPSELHRVAIIGPNAARAEIMGGGSATVRAMHLTTPLDELRRRLEPHGIEVVHERGCTIDLAPPALLAPFRVEIFEGHDLAGASLGARPYDTGRVLFFGDTWPGLAATQCSARARATFLPTETGTHVLQLVQAGWARVRVNGEVVIDGWHGGVPRGLALFGLGSVPLEASVLLIADAAVEIEVEWCGREAIFLAGFVLGLGLPDDAGLLDRAVAAAAAADVAIVVVGTNEQWETEGSDREEFHLPGGQDDLVRAVAAANRSTVVVINAVAGGGAVGPRGGRRAGRLVRRTGDGRRPGRRAGR